MSIHKIAEKYFLLEAKRRALAAQQDYINLKKTYRVGLELPNKNTGRFWDDKFKRNKKEELSNPMEYHRNETASQWFHELVSKKKSECLNLGCGDGKFEKLVYRYKKNFKLTSVDEAKGTISILREIFPDIKFIIGNILKIKFASQQFDIVTLFEVLEHISPRDVFDIYKKANTCLRQNGYLMVSVPMNEGLEQMYPTNPNAHLRCYSRDLICAELEMNDFRIVREKEFYAFSNYYSFKTLLAKFILKNKWKPNNILVLAQKRNP